MKNAKLSIVLYSVLVLLFSPGKYAFPIYSVSLEGDENGNGSTILPDFQVKAGVIGNLVNYCQWPTNSPVANPDIPFIIGALEENEVISFLSEITKTKKIGGKQAKILIISNDEEIKNCNLLFISGISENRLQQILETIGDLPILTVADVPDFEEKGVMINVFSVGKKIQFNVNLTAVRKNGLLLNSKLLRLALNVIQE